MLYYVIGNGERHDFPAAFAAWAWVEAQRDMWLRAGKPVPEYHVYYQDGREIDDQGTVIGGQEGQPS